MLWFFQWSCMDVSVELWRKLSAKKMMLLNCGAGEDYWESLGLQGDPTSPSLKEISPGCSLEGLMLKVKLQYFGHLKWKVDSLEKTLMLGGFGSRRRKGKQRLRWLMASPSQWTWVWVNSRAGDGQGGLECSDSRGHKESDTTEWLNWTELKSSDDVQDT